MCDWSDVDILLPEVREKQTEIYEDTDMISKCQVQSGQGHHYWRWNVWIILLSSVKFMSYFHLAKYSRTPECPVSWKWSLVAALVCHFRVSPRSLNPHLAFRFSFLFTVCDWIHICVPPSVCLGFADRAGCRCAPAAGTGSCCFYIFL